MNRIKFKIKKYAKKFNRQIKRIKEEHLIAKYIK